MRCRACGTEIAEKALVCYRCGAATAEPIHAPAPGRAPSSPLGVLASLLALALLVVLALLMRRFAAGHAPRAVVWTLAAVAVVIVALRAVARRR